MGAAANPGLAQLIAAAGTKAAAAKAVGGAMGTTKKPGADAANKPFAGGGRKAGAAAKMPQKTLETASEVSTVTLLASFS